MVTVRNDGNTLLTAGTIDLYREGSGQPFSSASIGFGANARMASIYDPELAEDASANDMAHVKYALETLGARFATHPLVADNGNAVLAPGCTAQFRMSFAIPESWSDEVGKRVTLYAKARNLVALDPVTLEEIPTGRKLGAECRSARASCARRGMRTLRSSGRRMRQRGYDRTSRRPDDSRRRWWLEWQRY